MKKWIALCAISLTASLAQAQTSESKEQLSTPTQTRLVTQGFTVSVNKEFSDFKIKGISSFNGSSIEFKEKADNRFGVKLGYSLIKVQKLGADIHLGYSQYEVDNTDIYSVTAAGNLNYGFNEVIYGYGGLNLSQIRIKDLEDLLPEKEYKVGAGIQLGLGAQMTENFSGILGYRLTQSSIDAKFGGFKTGEIEMSFSGLELGLIGTF